MFHKMKPDCQIVIKWNIARPIIAFRTLEHDSDWGIGSVSHCSRCMRILSSPTFHANTPCILESDFLLKNGIFFLKIWGFCCTKVCLFNRWRSNDLTNKAWDGLGCSCSETNCIQKLKKEVQEKFLMDNAKEEKTYFEWRKRIVDFTWIQTLLDLCTDCRLPNYLK